MEADMHETDSSTTIMTTQKPQLCRRCGFHPASPRIAGYCSWDCHDADDDEEGDEDDEGDGERAA